MPIQRNTWIALPLLAAVLLTVGCASTGDNVSAQRQEIRDTAGKTLQKLYSLKPSAKAAVESAAGYGAFSNFGMKLFVAGAGKGTGIVVDNASGREVFMHMVELQAGLGLGINEFSVVFVFETHEALNSFVESGWQFSAQATAAAQMDDKGAAIAGAVPVAEGIWAYQIVGDGLALDASLKETKFYKDDELN